MKLVQTDDWAIMQVLVRCLMTLAFVVWPIEVSSQTPGADFSKFKHDNPNHSRYAVPVVPSKETGEPRPGDARRRRTTLPAPVVTKEFCRLRPPDLHDLSYER